VRRHAPLTAPDHRDGNPSPGSFCSARKGHWSVLLRPSQRTPAPSRAGVDKMAQATTHDFMKNKIKSTMFIEPRIAHAKQNLRLFYFS
jgi:hypothetical protein